MDDSWKADNGTHSQSPSPVPSLVNRSNASISLSSIEPPPQPTTQVNLKYMKEQQLQLHQPFPLLLAPSILSLIPLN